MNKFIKVLIISTLFISFSAQKIVDKPVMEFKSTIYNVGKIKLGKKIKHTFEFTNKGNEPIFIMNVQTTCGCTASEWTKKPIQPNEKGFINIVFDAKSIGKFSKTAYVYANAKNSPVTLKIKGEVIK